MEYEDTDTAQSSEKSQDDPKAIGARLRKIADGANPLSPTMDDGDLKNQLEGVDRNQQAVIIGNHAKSVLQSATGSSRMMIKSSWKSCGPSTISSPTMKIG